MYLHWQGEEKHCINEEKKA